ncbi:leucine-rich repeat domain-containing protein [Oceanirhabdus seepicola]|uniref:Leucine-rich repeat domain-containing protein n=1 Tax=Oceanirhabdus seepicola TaxID=2828781 RepID=A0A9J6NYP2_9CLOT|nr:leucine-rich repeat domain-containing protein [Oceanirhabdus seepicola]
MQVKALRLCIHLPLIEVERLLLVTLKNLTKLTRLNLNKNEVSNIEPLKKLTKLTHLVLRRNKITNIEPLKNLKKLTGLYLWHNEITDYSPVEPYYDNLRYKDFELH